MRPMLIALKRDRYFIGKTKLEAVLYCDRKEPVTF